MSDIVMYRLVPSEGSVDIKDLNLPKLEENQTACEFFKTSNEYDYVLDSGNGYRVFLRAPGSMSPLFLEQLQAAKYVVRVPTPSKDDHSTAASTANADEKGAEDDSEEKVKGNAQTYNFEESMAKGDDDEQTVADDNPGEIGEGSKSATAAPSEDKPNSKEEKAEKAETSFVDGTPMSCEEQIPDGPVAHDMINNDPEQQEMCTPSGDGAANDSNKENMPAAECDDALARERNSSCLGDSEHETITKKHKKE